MSISRCGVSVNRDINLTRDYSDWPRWKQMNCQIEGRANYQYYDTKQEEQKSAPAVLDEMEIIEEKENLQGSGFFSSKLSKIMADVSNKFPDSDANARPIFPGEHHQLLKLRNKRFGRANFSGPGTRIAKRVQRGDPPRSEVDKIAQAHDIRYALARGVNVELKVREADTKMINKLNEAQKKGTDSKFNILPAKAGIKLKMKAEDYGIMSKKKFICDTDPSPSDQRILQSKLNELEQEGYGNDIPGQKLLKKYQRKVKNKKKSKSKKPLYTEELEISNMLADKLLQMVIS